MTAATAPADVYTGPPIASLLSDVNSYYPRTVLRAELLGGSPLRVNPTTGATSVEFNCVDCGDTIRLVALWQLCEGDPAERLLAAVAAHRVDVRHFPVFPAVSPAVDLTRAGGAD